MAVSNDNAVTSAEKAYSAAAADAKSTAPATKASAEPVKSTPAPSVDAKVEEPVAAAPEPVPAPKKAAVSAKPAPVKKAVAKPLAKKAKSRPKAKKPAIAAKTAKTPIKKAKSVRAPAAKPALVAVTKPVPTISQLKDKIMAAAKTTDFTKPFADAMGDMQTKATAAYEKSTAYAGEMTEFAKGNVEAIVESGKLLSTGMQDMGKTLVDEAKSAYETVSADVKEMASIKSPTELFQLQGKVARRNFDSMVAFSSKAGEDMMKLYTEAFAPISGRVSLATEKLSKAA